MLSIRTRKLIGTFVLVFYVIIYSLVAMTLAARLLPGTSGVLQMVFYVVAGLVWIFPLMPLIKWMQRPDAA